MASDLSSKAICMGPADASKLTEAMKASIVANGVRNVWMVGDKVCGIIPFAFSVGLVYNVLEGPHDTFERRYCFTLYRDALLSLELWSKHPTAVHAPGNWIKCKGSLDGRGLDHNPRDLLVGMSKAYPKDVTPTMIAAFDLEEGYPLIIPDAPII